MNASCLDEKGRFKSCPYRVYTDEQGGTARKWLNARSLFPPANVTTVRVMRLMMSAIMGTV